jgi:hypothetical protein
VHQRTRARDRRVLRRSPALGSSSDCSKNSWRTVAGTATPRQSLVISAGLHAVVVPFENLRARRIAGIRDGQGSEAQHHRCSPRGQEYLHERRLYRSRSTGQVINPAWTQVSFPTRWHYDILWGLDYLRRAGVQPDERMAEAIDLMRKKCDEHGRWPLENPHPGPVHFEMEGSAGEPSRWNTLRALRVLRWATRARPSDFTHYDRVNIRTVIRCMKNGSLMLVWSATRVTAASRRHAR